MWTFSEPLERLSEPYEKSYNVFNINTQDKGTQSKKGQLLWDTQGPPKLCSVSLSMCLPYEEQEKCKHVGDCEDLNNVRVNNTKSHLMSIVLKNSQVEDDI